ncbi:MAG: pantothenate kinase [Spirochaetaceae bacterium]|jgi:type II pantothenate kinase|nr:pantothenate kinase [Spirochaetaceae bacterium]
MIIGIDIGSTTTKAVAFKDDGTMIRVKTRGLDALTSASGALGKITIENNIGIGEIGQINITGVGAEKINADIFGIPTKRVAEFTAIGMGARYLCSQDRIIIANIGTGTVIIEADKENISHFGGTGVGGGTIMGLSKKLLQVDNFDSIIELASKGDLKKVDLLIEDIADTEIGYLYKDVTAANFGKISDNASREDLALAIFNMVYQVIGMLAAFAARSRGLNTVIVTGNGSNNPIGQNILAGFNRMFGISFEFPDHAEYTTAIGAALDVTG